MQIDRLIHGNPGSYRNLTDGVSELKIDVGPGYRVYYSKRGAERLCCTNPQRNESPLTPDGFMPQAPSQDGPVG